MLDLASTYPHVPVADMLARIRRDDEGRPRKHVLVLGAGMAGLVAARELQALGHTVRIVEGSDRIGGRILTHRFEDGSYNELGAMRVPASHDYTRHYIAAASLDDKLIPFVNSVPENFLDLHGRVVRADHGQEAIYPLYGLPESPTVPSTAYPQPNGGAIFAWLLGNVIATLTKFEQDSLFKGELTTDRLRALDGLSLGAFLDGMVPSEVKRLVGAYTSLAVWFDKAVTMFIRDQIVETGNGLQTLLGGMDQLPHAIAGKLLAPGTVEYRAEVTRIAVRPGERVEVDLQTPQGHRREVADFVLCTLPFGVMRQLALEGLSYEKTYAIGEMTYAASTKVILGFKHRFWEAHYGIYGGSSVSDGIQRQTYYPMDHIGSPDRVEDGAPVSVHGRAPTPRPVAPHDGADPSRPGALLGAYCWGADALRLGALSPERRAHAVRLGISRFHPEVMDDAGYTGHASICWATNKWSVGAFAFLRPGQLGSLWAAAGKPEGRLFFAGEHCSLDQAWIQGALISSLQAVDQIVKE